MRRRLPRAVAFALAFSVALPACTFQALKVEPVASGPPVNGQGPGEGPPEGRVDGRVREGCSRPTDALVGPGVRHDLALRRSEPVERVPLGEVAAMETFRVEVKAAETVVFSLLATAGVLSAAPCWPWPSSARVRRSTRRWAGRDVLEAETFSYSIAPLLETRDLDRLHATADAEGRVRLDVRNEALETHYINHLQLLEVRHAVDERVLPDAGGRAVVTGDLHPADQVHDRAGRDARSSLAAADGEAFGSVREAVARANAGDLEDWLDVSVPVPDRVEQVALVLRARSSLLNTVLFYDVMMARSGARALDWLGADLDRIGEAVELGRWVRRRLGLHVKVFRAGTFQEVARVPDPGPIAWRDVAVVVPVVPGERVARLRLSFLTDAWRIDRLQVAYHVREAAPRSIALAQVRGGAGADEAEARAGLEHADGRYLQTRPGQRFSAIFDAGPEPERETRTFLLSSQGYYTEWVRGAWLRGSANEAFVPSDEALLVALRRWTERRAAFEQAFEQNRVPVR